MSSVSFTARLDAVPLNRFHWRLLLVSGFGWMFDAMDVILVSFLIVPVKNEFGLDAGHIPWIASAGFIGMFIGAAAGIALSHLPGLPLIDSVGMGIGAMTVVMLGGLPLTAVLLTLVFLQADAINLISVVIVAVVVAWVASARLSRWLPQPPPAPAPAQTPAAAPSTS